MAEIHTRFAAAVGSLDSPERKLLQSLPVGAWSAIIQPGSMRYAYRPTVWDVVTRDAIEFASSGERGLMAPEDAFELAADSPALGTVAEFLAWNPRADPSLTDRESPLVEAAGLFHALIAFHRDDADPTAVLAADLDRILWAAGAAVGEDLDARKDG